MHAGENGAAPAMMRCATGMEKPTQPRNERGCAASAARIAASYLASPLPSITICAAAVQESAGEQSAPAGLCTPTIMKCRAATGNTPW